MANGLITRIKNFFIAEDEAVNALGGGNYKETISGTVGRAAGYSDYGAKPPKVWATYFALPVIDYWFYNGHCRDQAILEAKYRDKGK